MSAWLVAACVVVFGVFVALWQRRSLHNVALAPGDVLVVFAHPDDEAMFFTPLLTQLCARHGKHAVHLYCFSDGDAAGLGATRVREMHASARHFGVALSHVHVCTPPLPDGMRVQWPVERIRDTLQKLLQSQPHIRHVVTFDRLGVSGHVNHIAVHNGVAALASFAAASGVTLWQLRTRPLLLKYVGVAALLPHLQLPHLTSMHAVSTAAATASSAATAAARVVDARTPCQDDVVFVAPLRAVYTAWCAMQCHASQFAWFRKLFVLFSSYTYLCELQPLRTQ